MSSRHDEAAMSPFGVVGELLVDFNEVLRFLIRVVYMVSPSANVPIDLDTMDTSMILGEVLGNRDVFCGPPGDSSKLGPSEFNALHELRRVRNDWAHQRPISEALALRALDWMLVIGEAVVRLGKERLQLARVPPAAPPATLLPRVDASLRKIAYHRDLMVVLLAEKTLTDNATLAARLRPADFPTLSRMFGLHSPGFFDSPFRSSTSSCHLSDDDF